MFSKTDNKIFATFSKDKTIKIWNLEDPFCICNISVDNYIGEMQIYKDFLFYNVLIEDTIIKYNYQTFENTHKFQYDANNYIIINENKLCLFYEDSLSIIENDAEIKNYKFSDIYYLSFYDEDLKILYIFYAYSFDILNLENMTKILTGKINGEPIIFYSNILNEVNLCANFILLFRNRLEYYSFYYEDGYKSKIELNKKSISEQNIWDNVVPNISDIQNLRWTANSEEETKFKKYLNIDEIMKELENGYDKSLDEKKNEVEKEISNIQKSFKLDYIKLLKLMIKDNTNKTLVKKYLKYIEKNNDNLKLEYKDNFETFKVEYENYKIIFDNDELKKDNLKEKPFSQKLFFMNLLEEINALEIKDDENINNIDNNISNNNISNDNHNNINENKINSFINKINDKVKNLQLFNQPINISNKELYWQRNCHVLYFALEDILKDKNKLNLMKETIKIIIKKKIFEKEYIIKDNTLLTSIIMLIVIPQPKEYLEFNLNLIETKDPSYNYENEINNYNFTKIDIESYVIKHDNKNYLLNEPSTKCVKNFILNIKKKIDLDEFEEKNYNQLNDFFNELIDFEKMILFLSKIFTSNVFREAFHLLYPSYFKFPFENEKEAEIFLKKYYHFIPLKTFSTAGITEKFSLEIYYILKKRNITNSKTLANKINNLIIKILYRGSVVKTSCHEINHEFYNILFMHTNGKIPLQTPRKQYISEREGGRNMEVLLFNRKLYKLTLLECLYLLNERNYDKKLEDFRKGFNELNAKDLEFKDNSYFKEFNGIFKIENFIQMGQNTDIACAENEDSNIWNDTYINDIEDVNDILGFIRDPSKF